jgi:hypothetical protein
MRHLTPLLLLFASAPAVSAQTPRPAALVGQLGDPHFQTREAAGKRLIDLGEPALPALEAGLSSDVPEIARRCEDLIPAVKQKIDADLILTPTLVDLPAGEQTVQKVFDDLLKQTRYQIRVEGDHAVLSAKLKLTGGRVTFWEAVQSVCTAAKLDVFKVEAGVPSATRDRPPVGTVWLVAADGAKRVTTHKAVLIQVSPLPPDELASHPLDRSPLAVRTFPEPKVKWHRLIEAELVKASDKSGQVIGPGSRVFRTRYEHLQELAADSRDFPSRANPTGLNEAATRGVLHLAAGPTEVDSLSAVARFAAWKEAGELAVVRFADKANSGTADGPCGTRLTATVIGPVSNEPGSTTVEVKVRWDANRVRVEQSAAGGDAVWFENVNGRMVPVKAAPADAKGLATTEHGIRMTNAAGEPLAVTSRVIRFDSVRENGREYTEFSVKYVAKAGKLADGKPSAVAFHAARVVEMTVPFTAKDLPLSAGTRSSVGRSLDSK